MADLTAMPNATMHFHTSQLMQCIRHSERAVYVHAPPHMLVHCISNMLIEHNIAQHIV